MARKQTVIVTGYDEIDRKLHALESKVQGKVVRHALRKAGKLIQQKAKANLVSQDAVRTGKLKRGIRVRAMKRSRSRVGILVATTERREDSSGYPFGGAQLEFGHESVRPYPFLRPALYENERELKGIIFSDILATIEEITKPRWKKLLKW